MYCEKCGAKLQNDAKFCTNCGAMIESTTANAVQYSSEEPNNTTVSISKTERIVSWIMFVFFVVCALAFLPTLSSLVVIVAAILIIPLKQWDKIIKKWYIKFLIAIVLFVFALMIYPTCDHDWQITETCPATCTENGYNKLYCALCDNTKKERIDKTGHQYIEISHSEPTKNGNGEIVQECTLCKDRVITIITLPSETEALNEYSKHSVNELVEDLNNNAYNAKSFYKGKKVEITGIVEVIDASGKYFTLAPDSKWEMYDVQCFLTSKEHTEWLQKVSTGDVVTLQGVITDVGEILGYTLDIHQFIEVTESESFIQFSDSAVLQQLDVTEYVFSDSYYNYILLAIKNNSQYTVSISAAFKLFGADGSIVAAKDSSLSTVASQSETLIILSNREEYTQYEYELDVSEDTWFKPIVNEISYASTKAKNKEIISITNNSDSSGIAVQAYALFFDGDSLVDYDVAYFSDNDFEIKPGKTITQELNCKKDYSTVKFYFSGYKK